MKTENLNYTNTVFFRTFIGFILTCAIFTSALAQLPTSADTQIRNQASATYSDGNGNSFSTVSNTVTITVAKVAGLVITPDGQTNSAVVPGQSNVTFTFRVRNTGNFTDQVRFLANGASVQITGPATVTSAVISGTTSTDIFANTADVLQTLAQDGFVDVVVTATVNSTATAGSAIQVFLGDATTGTNFDNVASNSSAHEVRTVSTGAVNGSREARGDISVSVETDGLLRSVMTVPAGPVALGSNIVYGVQACNDGQRTLNPLTGDTSIYSISPIPLGTELSATQTVAFPTGTQFSITALTTAPNAATWTTTAPTTLSTVKRIRFPLAASIASATCTASFAFEVTVTTNNANTPIWAISESFAKNFVNLQVTDQSGDSITNQGDGNADFNEPRFPLTSATQGIQRPTLLLRSGNVLIGPQGSASANGPTGTNDDYTNRSVTTGIAGVAPGGVTTADGVITFVNTVQNTGNADDTFTLTAPTVPTGFTVEIFIGGSWVTVSGGGSTSIAVPFGQSADISVRITAPTAQTILTGFATTIRAQSGITTTNANNTIDRLYTGFIRMNKTFTINNTTGIGAATDPVPGANIVYTITYTNVVPVFGGTGNSTLTASGLVITEDGSVAPNNWATYTDHVVGATDSLGGTITGDTVGSTVLTDSLGTITVGPAQSGTFSFTRRIK